ncbi:MAG: uL15 family ribosomal protein [candidate division WWE3 bacterium]|nr:uL15 family ribosomal protein [candidate division WWE3 bacterium]
MITIHSLPQLKGWNKPNKRLGQGYGSGKGSKSGRGDKGQNSREGTGKISAFFQGGQSRLTKGLGWKRGVKNPANNPKAKRKRIRYKVK